MPKNAPIPVPSGPLLQWVIQNPKAAAAAIEAINKLIAIQVQLVQVGQLAVVKFPLRDTAENFLLPLPLVGPLPWGTPTGTVSRATFDTATVTTAQLAQRVAALEQDLQRIGILPSA